MVHSHFWNADSGGFDCAQQSDCTASEAAGSRTSAALALVFLPVFYLLQLTVSGFNSGPWKDFSLLCSTWGLSCVYLIVSPLIGCAKLKWLHILVCLSLHSKTKCLLLISFPVRVNLEHISLTVQCERVSCGEKDRPLFKIFVWLFVLVWTAVLTGSLCLSSSNFIEVTVSFPFLEWNHACKILVRSFYCAWVQEETRTRKWLVTWSGTCRYLPWDFTHFLCCNNVYRVRNLKKGNGQSGESEQDQRYWDDKLLFGATVSWCSPLHIYKRQYSVSIMTFRQVGWHKLDQPS